MIQRGEKLTIEGPHPLTFQIADNASPQHFDGTNVFVLPHAGSTLNVANMGTQDEVRLLTLRYMSVGGDAGGHTVAISYTLLERPV